MRIRWSPEVAEQTVEVSRNSSPMQATQTPGRPADSRDCLPYALL